MISDLHPGSNGIVFPQSLTTAPPPLPYIDLPTAALLPAELQNAESWVVWRGEWRWSDVTQKCKLAKIPCHRISGRNADMNDVANWSGVGDALAAVAHLRQQFGEHFGVGIVFHDQIGIVGVDLDGDAADGKASDRLQYLASLPHSYRDLSQRERRSRFFSG